MQIKLLTAPFRTYNHYMPPIALGVISQYLYDNNIKHDKDDLHVKLHHLIKNKGIDLSLPDDEMKRWEAYVYGKNDALVEGKVKKIAGLTKMEGYDMFLFSAIYPPLKDKSVELIPLALFRFLKKKYNPIIISSNEDLFKRDLKVVDKMIPSIPKLIKYFKEDMKIGIDTSIEVGTKQNLDGFPIELYRYQGKLMAGYFFFEGCPYNCYFCDRFFTPSGEKNIRKKVILPDTSKVVNDLKEFVSKYRIKDFMFLNTTINPTRKFATEFANKVIEEDMDIMWCDCANFTNMTFEILDLLKKSGCVQLVFGLETASKKLQKRINKPIDLDHVEKIIRHCYEIGIWVKITLLCGLPYETYQDLYETLLFIKKNYKYLRGINLNRFMMKLSDFYYNPEKHGIAIREVKNRYVSRGFDELDGMKWEEKWKYTEGSYNEILRALDPIRVNYDRPVHHVFRVFSNKVPVSVINKYLNTKILSSDTTKLDILIEKYKVLA